MSTTCADNKPTGYYHPYPQGYPSLVKVSALSMFPREIRDNIYALVSHHLH